MRLYLLRQLPDQVHFLYSLAALGIILSFNAGNVCFFPFKNEVNFKEYQDWIDLPWLETDTNGTNLATA